MFTGGMTEVRDEKAKMIFDLEWIENWIFNHPQADELELILKFWEVSARSWSAQIVRVDTFTGETITIAGLLSMNAETMEEAIDWLVAELQRSGEK